MRHNLRFTLSAILLSSVLLGALAENSTQPAVEATTQLLPTFDEIPATGEVQEKQETRQPSAIFQDLTALLTALFTKSPKDIFNAATTFVSEALKLPGAPYQLMLIMPSFLSPDRLYRMLNPFVLGPLANFAAALVTSITVPMTAEYKWGDGPIGSTGVGNPVDGPKSRIDEGDDLYEMPPEMVYQKYYRKPYRNPYNDNDAMWQANSFIV